MDLFQAMKVFIKVAETGSLSGAARALDISNPSVTRHVCDLESYLSARLFNRSTRRLSLTETGAAYLERCRQVLAAVEDAASAASSSVADPSGTLRVSAPVSFAVNRLGRVLPRYAQRYPRVQLDVALSDRVVDLVEEGYDLAIRIGNIQDSSLVARKIAPMRLAVCASPDYLARHGSPQAPRDLERHACLNYSYWALRDEWQFTREGVTESVRIAGTMRVNNGDLLREAALAGMGIVMQPTFIVGDDIRNGALVPVLADYRLPESAIHAVYPSRQHLSAKVRTFIDFLVQELDPARESRAPG